MARKITTTDKSAQTRQTKSKHPEKKEMTDKEYDLYWSQTMANLPRLMIPLVGTTEYTQEHLPELNRKWVDWLHLRHLLLRMRFNKPIYYWHVRALKNPFLRKRYDLMFAAHVICDHDGEPTDKVEQRHYKWLKHRYGAELEYFKPIFEANKNGEHTYWDTYAQAYADQWIRHPYPELKMLFHGMNTLDFLDYRDYEDFYLKTELRKVLARHAAQSRWMKAKSKQ